MRIIANSKNGSLAPSLGIRDRCIFLGGDTKRIVCIEKQVGEFRRQMRVALSNMASNTGFNSPGELEMTPRTSDVAVCCSRASFSLCSSSAILSVVSTAGGSRPTFDALRRFNVLGRCVYRFAACFTAPPHCLPRGSGQGVLAARNSCRNGQPRSALGHKRTFAVQNGMSALPPKADMCSATRYVRFVPIADTSIATKNYSINSSARIGLLRTRC